MILVFGGTTEGRKAVEMLEEGGSPYFYSTKTGEQDLTLHHGQRIDGALDAEAMQNFCRENDIRLIVDAAHPFAVQLHQTSASFLREMLVWNGSTAMNRCPMISKRCWQRLGCRASAN